MAGWMCDGLAAWWITPPILAIFFGALLGYFYPRYWQIAFVSLIFPSTLARQIAFFAMPGGPGNLWPVFLAFDVALVCLVALSTRIAAWFGVARQAE